MVLADAWSDNGRANESDPTANGMDDSGACEIMESCPEDVHHERALVGIAEPAATPSPVARDGIDTKEESSDFQQSPKAPVLQHAVVEDVKNMEDVL